MSKRKRTSKFLAKFPKGFLEKYDSTLIKDDEYNWLKVLTCIPGIYNDGGSTPNA